VDKRFLEFLGNFFIHAAQGQKQLDDIAGWMQQGYAGYEELTAMFLKFYGLEPTSPFDTASQTKNKKALQEFEDSFNIYLRAFGVVSESEHQQLKDEYEKLKHQCEEQQKTIRSLKMLLDAKYADTNEFIQNMQDIMTNQNELFQQLMQSVWEIEKKDSKDR
jgi:hypothetical protein